MVFSFFYYFSLFSVLNILLVSRFSNDDSKSYSFQKNLLSLSNGVRTNKIYPSSTCTHLLRASLMDRPAKFFYTSHRGQISCYSRPRPKLATTCRDLEPSPLWRFKETGLGNLTWYSKHLTWQYLLELRNLKFPMKDSKVTLHFRKVFCVCLL